MITKTTATTTTISDEGNTAIFVLSVGKKMAISKKMAIALRAIALRDFLSEMFPFDANQPEPSPEPSPEL